MSNSEATPAKKPTTFVQKLQFVGKVIVFLLTFGFVFPTLFGD